MQKEMIAMLLEGEQESRLGVLTAKFGKSVLAFGGKYRTIDFSLSNCIHSGIDTVGVLPRHQSLRLHSHIGIGIPWDLDRSDGGVTILPPYQAANGSGQHRGMADALYENMAYIESYHPEYVLILPGSHIYKMNYEAMLDFHKEQKADVTVATRPVLAEEEGQSDVVFADGQKRIKPPEEKTAEPGSTLISMGIYLFSWNVLKEALLASREENGCDMAGHIIPYCCRQGRRVYAYLYEGYWKRMDTLVSYWETNMELTELIPECSLDEEYWKIYTKNDVISPQYLAPEAVTEKSIIAEGVEIYGEVYHSVIGSNVTIQKGAVVRNSIIMKNTDIGEDTVVDKAIIAEGCRIGSQVSIGVGEEAPNQTDPFLYRDGLVTIGEDSVIPDHILIGKNTVVVGVTTKKDYIDGKLFSGGAIIKE